MITSHGGIIMKTGYKVLSIILGILMIICGIYCLTVPELTFLALGWIVAFSMIIDGVINLATWNARKALGFADGWTLLGGVLSLGFGIAVIASETMQLALDITLAYMAGIWILWIGILRLARSVRLRHIHKELHATGIAKHWWLVMLTGILLIVVGIFSLMNPGILVLGIGILIGVDILLAGINAIILSCIA